MKHLSRFFISLIFFQLGFTQHTDVINSNRPGESMTAFSVGKNVSQIETGVSYTNQNFDNLGIESRGASFDLNLRHGIFLETLELVGQFNFQTDQYKDPFVERNRTAIRKSNLGAKYLVYDPNKYYEPEVNIFSWKANQGFKWRQLIPAVAVYAGADLNFSSNQFQFIAADVPLITPRAMLITQNQLGNRWVLVTNSFIEEITSPTYNYGYIVTLTHAFNQKFSAFLENKGLFGDYYSDQILSGGFAHLLNENNQVDLIISRNLKNTPALFFAGIGFSARFDKRQEDMVIRVRDKSDKNSQDKSAKKQKKNKQNIERIPEAIEN